MSETIGALYKEGAALLAAAEVREADHDARALLSHVLDIGLNDVILKMAQPADEVAERIYRHLLDLRASRMPLQYVTRNTFFYGLELRVDDRVLIPRPDTELLVETMAERLRRLPEMPGYLVDVGCGSGAIGLALAVEFPDLRVIMTDISAPALEVTRENARRLGLQDRVTILQGSYLEPVTEAGLTDQVFAIVANPPYVRPREMSMVEAEVHAEPLVAIASPVADGLEGFQLILGQAAVFPRLRLLAMEVGFAQADEVVAMATPLGETEVVRDLQDIERVVVLHIGGRAPSGKTAEVLVSDPGDPDAGVVARAAEALRTGRLVVLPTDTVYGLACRADDEVAVRRLFALKGRSHEKALPILLPNREALGQMAAEVPAAAERLAEAFWPGPLTLVVQKLPVITSLVSGGQDTVGVRVPDLPLTQSILAACDFPVAVTSANLADEPPATKVGDLLLVLRETVGLIVDGGPCPGGTPSTVVDVTVEPPAVLREGPVTDDDIQGALAAPNP